MMMVKLWVQTVQYLWTQTRELLPGSHPGTSRAGVQGSGEGEWLESSWNVELRQLEITFQGFICFAREIHEPEESGWSSKWEPRYPKPSVSIRGSAGVSLPPNPVSLEWDHVQRARTQVLQQEARFHKKTQPSTTLSLLLALRRDSATLRHDLGGKE